MGTAMLGVLAATLLAGCALAGQTELAAPEARVAAGSLRGKWVASKPSGRAVAAFEGIPFAKPPVGELRFKAPMAKEPWSGVLVADKTGPVCPQRAFSKPNVVEGSEDCLYLNVYYPKLTADKTLPVMVFVHGGGFTTGAGSIYGPEYVTDRDVVFVNFNYRLGPLGFLSTADDAVPGNQGMKDMVLALQWVRDNIRAFGGDPDSVTIFGESAGAASVHYLALSPLAKGLFHRAIQMSGSALAPWAFYEPARARAKTDKLAAALGCPTHCSKALRDCLVTKPFEDIIRGDVALLQWLYHPMVLFRPTAEPSGPGAFLDKHPAKVYADGGAHDVAVMTGVTTHEGCIVVVPIAENETALADFDQHFTERAAVMLFTDHLPQSLNHKQFSQLRQAYFGDKAINSDTVDEFLDLTTDAFFSYASIESVKLHARSVKSPVFLYELGHTSDRTFATAFGASKATKAKYGVCHADDLPYLFSVSEFVPEPPSESDMAFSSTLLDLFTTFAATGAPTKDGSWPAVKDLNDKTEFAYLGGPGPVSVRRGFHNERMERWAKFPVNVNPGLALSSHARDEL
ncbi:venom carboxylesterase-6-like [Thrips palmi]|uniref:Carboxylic ester hydrolase n=1 Tax=Thrips palmi TaxID=161013 RepID=A0A6P8Z3V8_THRPL|nr:venom carboxylesterase-6-like [Thrips palmi]